MNPPYSKLGLISVEEKVVSTGTLLVNAENDWDSTELIADSNLYNQTRLVFVKNKSQAINLYLARGTYTPGSGALYLGAVPTIDISNHENIIGPLGWDWFSLAENEVLLIAMEAVSTSNVLVRVYRYL